MDFSRASFDTQRHVFVSLNDYCNRRCTYCYLPEHALSHSRPVEATALMAGLTRLYERHGFRLLTIAGGEPGLVTNITDYLERIAGIGYGVIINTNGALALRRLKNIDQLAIRAVSFSLDSCDPDVNDRLRFKGSFELVQRGVRYCREREIPIRVSAVISAVNRHELFRLFEWCNVEGVDVLNVHELDPSIDPQLLGPLKLPPSEWRDMIRTLAVEVRAKEYVTALRLPVSYLTRCESKRISDYGLSCPATLNDTLCVTPDLATYRCPLLVNRNRLSYRSVGDALETEPLDQLSVNDGCARCPLSEQANDNDSEFVDACKLVKVTINRVTDGSNTPVWADLVRQL